MQIRPLILQGADVERVREAGGPLAEVEDLSKLRNDATVIAIEVDGQIIAYWPAFYALHLEPLWIKDEFRKSPGVNRALLELVASVVTRTEEPVAFAIIENPEAESFHLADRLGFARVPGDLYYVMCPAAEPVGG